MTHTKDRDYYRCIDDKQLIEETKYSTDPDWHELAVVLAERLADAHYKHDALRYDYRAELNDYDY